MNNRLKIFQFRNYSLRTKLLMAFIGITLVAVGALATYVFISTTNILRQGLESQLTEHTDKAALSVGALFNEQIGLLTALSLNEVLEQGAEAANQAYTGDTATIQAELDAKDVQWRSADAADNNSDPLVHERLTNQVALELNEFQEEFPNHVEVFVTDLYGGQAGTTNRTSDYYQADEGWWQAAYNNGKGALYISEPEFDESAGVLSVLIALPLRNDETGKIVGILRTTYMVSALNPILEEPIGKTGETNLIIPGEVVSYYASGQMNSFEPEEYAKIKAAADQGVVEMNYEGIPSVVVQAPVRTSEGNQTVNKLGWVVLFHQHQNEALAPINARVRGALIVIAIILAIAILAATGISLFLVRPIIQLTRTAEEIASGDLNSRAEVAGSDEVGILASTFNKMTSQLQETLEGLEQRVGERTKALATSAEVTRRLSTATNPRQLAVDVVEQVQSAFHYYHAHIYFLDETSRDLIMAGGTGEAGAAMLAGGHKVSKGRGLVGRAAETNAPVLVSDVSKDPNWLPNPLLPETKSEIAVPISIGDQVLGVLDVQDDKTDSLQQNDADVLQSIANQVAIALQNTRQYQQAQKRAVELASVAEVSTVVSKELDVQKMLEAAVHLTQRRFGLYHAHVFLYDENTEKLQIAACGWKEGDDHEGTHCTAAIPLQQEQSLVARAARTRQAVIVNDVRSNPDWLPNPLLPDTQAEMALPLVIGDQMLGVLDVQSDRLNAFSDEDASIQATLASQVATALQNAHTFSQAQQQAERESMLNTISQKIQSATTVEAVLQIAARELGHALGAPLTIAQLGLKGESNGGNGNNRS